MENKEKKLVLDTPSLSTIEISEPKEKPLNIYQKLNKISTEVGTIITNSKNYFGKSAVTPEELYRKLQPLFEKNGVVLTYNVKNISTEPIIIPDLAKGGGVTTQSIRIGANEKGNSIYRDEIISNRMFLAEMTGKWINSDDRFDYVEYSVLVPWEQEYTLSSAQSLGKALTYTFRTFLIKSLLISGISETDPDFENVVTEEVKEKVEEKKRNSKPDTAQSSLWKQIILLDQNNKYVQQKNSEFMNIHKIKYPACPDYYNYLKIYYETDETDVLKKGEFRKELKDVLSLIETNKKKEINNGAK